MAITNQPVILVCGFGRCGSSLIMQMLDVGGISCFHDPGMGAPSYETFLGAGLPRESAWLSDLGGRAVKLLNPHHFRPPQSLACKIVWLDRDYQEQAKSTAKFSEAVMGIRLNAGQVRQYAKSFAPDRAAAMKYFDRMPNAQVRIFKFEKLITDSEEQAERLAEFAGLPKNTAQAMAEVVIPRPPRCLDGLLETYLLERADAARKKEIGHEERMDYQESSL